MSDQSKIAIEASVRLRVLELRLTEIHRQFQVTHERDAHTIAEANRSIQLALTHNRLLCMTLIKEMKKHVTDLRLLIPSADNKK